MFADDRRRDTSVAAGKYAYPIVDPPLYLHQLGRQCPHTLYSVVVRLRRKERIYAHRVVFPDFLEPPIAFHLEIGVEGAFAHLPNCLLRL